MYKYITDLLVFKLNRKFFICFGKLIIFTWRLQCQIRCMLEHSRICMCYQILFNYYYVPRSIFKLLAFLFFISFCQNIKICSKFHNS